MKDSVKKIFLAIFFLALFLPHFQMDGDELIESKEEKYYNEFSYFSWKNGEFKDKFESTFFEYFPNKSFFTKLRNQLDFTFFGKSNNENLVIGEDKILFDIEEINEITGDNYIGENYVNQKLERLQYINDKLAAEKKKLILVLGPSKAYYHKDKLKQNPSSNTNYTNFANQLKQFEIPYLDFNEWTSSQNSEEQDFYPLTGSDLNHSVSVEILDSILKFTSKRIETPLKQISISDITAIPDTSSNSNPLQLLFPKEKLDNIADFTFEGEAANNNRITCIGDDGFKKMFETDFASEVFESGSFWLNGKEVYQSDNLYSSEALEPSNLPKEIDSTDIVLFYICPDNLDRFGFGLVDYLYDFYSPEGGTPAEYSEYEQYAYLKRQSILQNNAHKSLIFKQAKEKNINYYDNIRGHVEYELSLLDKGWSYTSDKLSDYQAQSILAKNTLLKEENGAKKIKEIANKNKWSEPFTLEQEAQKFIKSQNINGFSSVRDNFTPLHLAVLNIENKILMDKDWSALVKKQSLEQKISFEQCLWNNAEYTVWLEFKDFYSQIDEAARWVNNLYYSNELFQRKNWMKSMQVLIEKRNLDINKWQQLNIEYLAYINRKSPLVMEIDEAYTLQHQSEIRKDSVWMETVKADAKKKNISTEASLRSHAEYIRFLRKQEGSN